MKKPTTTIFSVVSAFALLTSFVASAVLTTSGVNAAQITVRSLELEEGDGGPLLHGGSRPSNVAGTEGIVDHHFTFTLGNANNAIGAIQFQYCTTAADVGGATCSPPSGLNSATSTLGSSSIAGMTMQHSSANVYYLTRAPGATIQPGANAVVDVLVKDVKNPETIGTFFVRIATFASFDATGSPIDTGTVAASTADPIELSGVMPESLVFCTGSSIGLTGGVPDCSTATDGIIAFNQLFSPTDTAYSLSQMAASTNAGQGYIISVNGPTLTSGGNTVLPMGVAAGPGVVITRGTSQFGMNLVANTSAVATGIDTPNPLFYNLASADPSPIANATNYRGQPVNGYETADAFKYVDGETVAASTNGGPGATDAQIYTVSYIANVPGSQAAGTYSTTLTYICTPTF